MAAMTSFEYGRLVAPWLARAAGYARSLLHDRDDAQDAVQQAALRGFERIGTYDAGRPFKGWWFAILRHCCLDLLRARRPGRVSALGDSEPVDDRGTEPGRWLALAEALSRLSEEHEEILRLRYFGGLDYRELAAALGVPAGTVMSRLHAARLALAQRLPKEET